MLIVSTVSAIIYAVIVKLREGVPWREIGKRLGLTWGEGRYYLWAMGFTILGTSLGLGALESIPTDAMNSEKFALSRFVGQPLTVTSFLSALNYGLFATGLGEELLFRGLIGGWLGRRTKLWVANGIQAFVFTLPNLLILVIEPRLWPMTVAIPFVSGLMLGWLRLKSGSIVPGWIVLQRDFSTQQGYFVV